MTINPTNALATIRQAYRYIEQYQQRVLDAYNIINAELATAGFVLMGWDSSSRFRTDHKHPFELGARDWLPLMDLECTWSRGAKQETERGSGTYVIVRHISDTEVNPEGLTRSAVPGGDSVLHVFVVRPFPEFTKDEFGKDWIRCMAEHFDLGPNLTDLSSLTPRGLTDGPTTTQGMWSVQVLSLADVAGRSDFSTRLVQPLAAKAREFAGLVPP